MDSCQALGIVHAHPDLYGKSVLMGRALMMCTDSTSLTKTLAY